MIDPEAFNRAVFACQVEGDTTRQQEVLCRDFLFPLVRVVLSEPRNIPMAIDYDDLAAFCVVHCWKQRFKFKQGNAFRYFKKVSEFAICRYLRDQRRGFNRAEQIRERIENTLRG